MRRRFSLTRVSRRPQRQLRALIAGCLVPPFDTLFRMAIVNVLGEGVRVRITRCERMGQLFRALESDTFDLGFLRLHDAEGPIYEELEAAGRMPGWAESCATQTGGYVSLQGRAIIGVLGRLHGMPVLVLHFRALDPEVALSAGATECLSMPCTMVEMSEAVRNCLRG